MCVVDNVCTVLLVMLTILLSHHVFVHIKPNTRIQTLYASVLYITYICTSTRRVKFDLYGHTRI